MIKSKAGFVLFSFLLISGCSGTDQQNSAGESEEIQIQIVNDLDSLSFEISAASDSLDKKVNDLQATLDNLNN